MQPVPLTIAVTCLIASVFRGIAGRSPIDAFCRCNQSGFSPYGPSCVLSVRNIKIHAQTKIPSPNIFTLSLTKTTDNICGVDWIVGTLTIEENIYESFLRVAPFAGDSVTSSLEGATVGRYRVAAQ